MSLMRKLMVEIPDELVELIGGDDSQAGHLMTQATVAELVRRRVISSGKASELLGISRWDLPDLLSAFEVSVTDLRSEDLEPFSR
jgi:hypothetical protein